MSLATYNNAYAAKTVERLESAYVEFKPLDPQSWVKGAMVELARDENGSRAGELEQLTQPTLLLWGARDIAYPPERFAALFERDIPAARLELIEGSGHYPQEERPDAVVKALESFLGVGR